MARGTHAAEDGLVQMFAVGLIATDRLEARGTGSSFPRVAGVRDAVQIPVFGAVAILGAASARDDQPPRVIRMEPAIVSKRELFYDMSQPN